ncbi:MAG: SPOR domain-containing protein [Proteobacteria bacterium]|nr:SPOR domain-containing protein [Pseudomonadota bacterium]
MSKTKLCLLLILSTVFNSGCMQEINRSLTKHEARESYYSGNFARSFRLTEAMAYQNDPKAKYTLGYMYFYGIGAPVNKSLGVAWIKESALDGYPPAIMALEKLTYSQLPLVSENAQPKIIKPTSKLEEIDETQAKVIVSKEKLIVDGQHVVNEDNAGVTTIAEPQEQNSLIIQSKSIEIQEPPKPLSDNMAKDQTTSIEKPVLPETAPSKVDMGWIVQVGTFGNNSYGTAFVAKLQRKEFPVFTRKFNIKGKDLIAVYIGPFKDKEKLQICVDNLKVNYKFTDIIVRKNYNDINEKAIAHQENSPKLENKQKEFSLFNDFTSLSFLQIRHPFNS